MPFNDYNRRSRSVELLLVYLLPSGLINLGNVAAYLFQVLVARNLDLDAYSNFNAIVSAVVILAAPASSIQLVVAQAALAVNRCRAQERRLLERTLAATAVGGVIIIAAAAAAAFGLREDLRLPPAVAIAAIAALIFHLIQVVPVGLLQAHRRYMAAAIILGGNPVVRLLLGLVLIMGPGLGETSAVWSVALPALGATLLGLTLLADVWRGPSYPLPQQAKEILWRTSGRQTLMAIFIVALTNLDVVIARLVLPHDLAGLYSGAAVVGRIAILLPSALAAIIFTESARRHEHGESQGHYWTGLVITALIASGLALAFALTSHTVLTTMLGAKFESAEPVLKVIGIAMAILAVTQAYVMSLAGRNDYRPLGFLVAAVLALVLLPGLLRVNAIELAELMLGINATLLAACLLLCGAGRGRTAS